jgi:uncharacterized membrane protein (DUF4010 family)
MINQDLFLRFGAALLIGVLIGMQREYAYSNKSAGGLFAGARTFALYLYFSQIAVDEEELDLSNPFELGPAIKFGLIFCPGFICYQSS